MNVDNTGLFAGEQPAPISMENSGRGQKSRQSSTGQRKRSASAKKAKTQTAGKSTYARNQSNKYKKSVDKFQKKIGAKDTKPKTLDSSGWNDNVATGKYFDVNIDERERRALQARSQKDHVAEKAAKIIKASGAAIQVKTANEEPGKYNVEF